MPKLHTPPPPGHITAKDFAKTGVKCIPAMFPKPHTIITDDRKIIHFPQGIQPLPEFLREHYSLKYTGVQLIEAVSSGESEDDDATGAKRKKRSAA